jgi:hypothetical protein
LKGPASDLPGLLTNCGIPVYEEYPKDRLTMDNNRSCAVVTWLWLDQNEYESIKALIDKGERKGFTPFQEFVWQAVTEKLERSLGHQLRCEMIDRKYTGWSPKIRTD